MAPLGSKLVVGTCQNQFAILDEYGGIHQDWLDILDDDVEELEWHSCDLDVGYMVALASNARIRATDLLDIVAPQVHDVELLADVTSEEHPPVHGSNVRKDGDVGSVLVNRQVYEVRERIARFSNPDDGPSSASTFQSKVEETIARLIVNEKCNEAARQGVILDDTAGTPFEDTFFDGAHAMPIDHMDQYDMGARQYADATGTSKPRARKKSSKRKGRSESVWKGGIHSRPGRVPEETRYRIVVTRRQVSELLIEVRWTSVPLTSTTPCTPETSGCVGSPGTRSTSGGPGDAVAISLPH